MQKPRADKWKYGTNTFNKQAPPVTLVHAATQSPLKPTRKHTKNCKFQDICIVYQWLILNINKEMLKEFPNLSL